MNKAERLNDMLQFINGKKTFNLKDIMERYRISKSTAIRDIQSLERLGMPIYTEQGRHGKYVVLDNRILNPIIFNVDEMYALYFAMQTLSAYKSNPFEYEMLKMEEKFNKVLPNQAKVRIERMKQFLQFEVTNHSNVSPHLRAIIEGIIEESVYLVSYCKQKETIQMTGQFMRLSSKFGQWYATFYLIDKKKFQVLRCDKIISLVSTDNRSSIKLEELHSLEQHHKQAGATSFSVMVTEQGKDVYDKEHYPSMSIEAVGSEYLITGYYNEGEEEFISSYFLRYGKSLISVHPAKLQSIMKNKLLSTLKHLDEMRIE